MVSNRILVLYRIAGIFDGANVRMNYPLKYFVLSAHDVEPIVPEKFRSLNFRMCSTDTKNTKFSPYENNPLYSVYNYSDLSLRSTLDQL